MTAVLDIQLLGGLQIRQNGVPLTKFISSKAPALLVYLAFTRRTVQRDALAALLWGDMAEADAKNNLRQALANLRKLVASHLIITRDTVAFDTAVSHTLDTREFEQQIQQSRTQERHRFAHLAAAAALYQGAFLAGFYVRDAPEFEEWMLAQRLRFQELALHALHELAENHLNRGEYGAAIDHATRLLALDAWREEAHRQLMVALVRSGQRRAALAQYETCRRLLAMELGSEPSRETTALFHRIQAAAAIPPHNLPPQPTPFVGRSAELAQLQTLLLNPACHLITLFGSGGIGKSRLALKVAERAHQQGLFLHGVYFVSLLGIDSSAGLATAVSQALSLPLAGSQSPTTQLLTHLRDKELLLLLDNFEHLLGETAWLLQLLHQAPGVKLLVTSRELIEIQWEWPVVVEGLSVPTAAARETAGDFTAVQLFVDRAHMVQPAFAATDDSLTAVIDICQMVGGMPLALELAAAATRHYTCGEVAAAIAENLDFLTSRYRDTPPRQRSLRAVFDYAWQQLTAVEQAVFTRCSLFQGGFTAAAALQIAAASTKDLALLVEKSLLVRGINGRYQFHQTVQQYAADRLAQRDDPFITAVYASHADYYYALAQQAEAHFHGADQADWLAQLDAEQLNFQAILARGFAQDQHRLAANLASSLWQYWYLRSRYRDGLAWLTKAQPHLPDLPAQTQSKIWRGTGVFATQLGQYEQAVACLEKSLAIQRRCGTPTEVGLAINSLAVVLQAQGKLAEAMAHYQEGLALQREAGDQIGRAQTLQNMGAAAVDMGDYPLAQRVSLESLALFRQLKLKWGIAYSSINLALAYVRQGVSDQARLHISEGLQLCHEIESLDSVAECLEVLATIEQREGNGPLAAQLLARADWLREQVGSPRQAGSATDYEQLTAVLQQTLGAACYAANQQTGQTHPFETILTA